MYHVQSNRTHVNYNRSLVVLLRKCSQYIKSILYFPVMIPAPNVPYGHVRKSNIHVSTELLNYIE